jgi:hypothetical protein
MTTARLNILQFSKSPVVGLLTSGNEETNRDGMLVAYVTENRLGGARMFSNPDCDASWSSILIALSLSGWIAILEAAKYLEHVLQPPL